MTDYTKIDIDLLKIELKDELLKKRETDAHRYNKIFKFTTWICFFTFITELVISLSYWNSNTYAKSIHNFTYNTLIILIAFVFLINMIIATINYIFLQVIIHHIRENKSELKLLKSLVHNK